MNVPELTTMVEKAVYANSPEITEARAQFSTALALLAESVGSKGWNADDGRRLAAFTVRCAYARSPVALAGGAFDAAVDELTVAAEKGWDVVGSMLDNPHAAALPIGIILTMVLTIVSGFITNPTVKAFLLNLIEILRNLPI